MQDPNTRAGLVSGGHVSLANGKTAAQANQERLELAEKALKRARGAKNELEQARGRWQAASHYGLEPSLRHTILPGASPVISPSESTLTPFTITYSTPSANRFG